jgi:hypothetical protein
MSKTERNEAARGRAILVREMHAPLAVLSAIAALGGAVTRSACVIAIVPFVSSLS